MFRKSNTGILLAVFIVLLAVVIFTQIRKPKTERTIDKTVFTFDTAQIDKITIAVKDNKNDLELVKKDKKWHVKQADKNYVADEQKIQHILSTLSMMEPKRLAAKSKDKWKEYKVTDSLGTLVEISSGKETNGLIIGKFSYQQPKNQSPYQRRQQGIMNTYVRPIDKNDVYVVDGFLRMTFSPQISQYRDKTIIEGNKENWTKLAFSYPADSSFVLEKKNNAWMTNGNVIDSASVAKYMNTIARLSSSQFLDENKYQAANASHTLKIDGNNMLEPITIQAVPADSTNKYAIHSSLNKEAWFSGAQANIFSKLFISKDKLTTEN